MINPCAPRLPEEVIRRAKNLNVPLLLDGVKAGEKVVTQGQTSLGEGSKVQDISNGKLKNGNRPEGGK